MHFLEDFRQEKCSFGSKKKCFLGKKCKHSKYAPDENFCAHFCPRRKVANFCHPASKSDGDPVYLPLPPPPVPIWNYLKRAPATHFDFHQELVLGHPFRLSEKLCDKGPLLALLLLLEWSTRTFYGYMDRCNELYSEYSINQNWSQSTLTLSNPNHPPQRRFKRAWSDP